MAPSDIGNLKEYPLSSVYNYSVTHPWQPRHSSLAPMVLDPSSLTPAPASYAATAPGSSCRNSPSRFYSSSWRKPAASSLARSFSPLFGLPTLLWTSTPASTPPSSAFVKRSAIPRTYPARSRPFPAADIASLRRLTERCLNELPQRKNRPTSLLWLASWPQLSPCSWQPPQERSPFGCVRLSRHRKLQVLHNLLGTAWPRTACAPMESRFTLASAVAANTPLFNSPSVGERPPRWTPRVSAFFPRTSRPMAPNSSSSPTRCTRSAPPSASWIWHRLRFATSPA